MAEEIKNTVTNETDSQQGGNEQAQNNGPTVEELMVQLAAARADADRYKSANDKLSKSEAEMKRQLRETLSADERKKVEEEEARRLVEEEREALRQENNRYKALNAYKTLDEATVDSLLGAISEADHSAIATIISKECEKAVAKAEAEWLKDRPRVQHGGASSAITKEQIMATKDSVERQRLIAENMDLFHIQ